MIFYIRYLFIYQINRAILIKLIDSNFWESIKYGGNHFIEEHFHKWASNYLSVKKKQLNIKSFVYKENTEHIVRKPNLYFDSNEVYFYFGDPDKNKE